MNHIYFTRRSRAVAIMLVLVAFVANTNHGWIGLPLILLSMTFAFMVIAPWVNGEDD